jgi:iron only hydrogenase large subunit-like protein
MYIYTQACINPIFSKSANAKKEKKNNTGAKITIDLEDDSTSNFILPLPTSKTTTRTKSLILESSTTKTAQITLNDCLACSGCVTSAETVLIEQQSFGALRKAIDSKRHKFIVVSISEEARTSLAVQFNINSSRVHWKLRDYFHKLAGKIPVVVVDASIATDVALVETRAEFLERFQGSTEKKNKVGWKRPAASVAVSSTRERVMIKGEVKTFDDVADHASTVAEGAAMMNASLPPVKRARKIESNKCLPMLVSSCPGWVCYAEKRHPEAIPYMSTVKSPQQILGSFVKLRLPKIAKILARPSEVLHVSIMACFDKKLEASRLDFFHDESEFEEEEWGKNANVHEVDLVLTASELIEVFQSKDEKDETFTSRFDELEQKLSNFSSDGKSRFSASHAAHGGSGGFVDDVLRFAARELLEEDGDVKLKYNCPRRSDENFQEVTIESKRKKLKFALIYGFRHIQKIVRQLRSGRCKYDFVEIMACPGGCLNGGGQARPDDFKSVDAKLLLEKIKKEFETNHPLTLYRDPEKSPFVAEVNRWCDSSSTVDDARKQHLHTRYHAVPEMPKNVLAIQW